jgi:hypothetical protein
MYITNTTIAHKYSCNPNTVLNEVTNRNINKGSNKLYAISNNSINIFPTSNFPVMTIYFY